MQPPLLFPAQERSCGPAHLAASRRACGPAGTRPCPGLLAGCGGSSPQPVSTLPRGKAAHAAAPVGAAPQEGAAPAALPAGAACRAGLPWILSRLKQRCRGEEGSRFCSSPGLPLPEPAARQPLLRHVTSAASSPPGRAQEGARGKGAAFGSGTHSPVHLGPTEPEQLQSPVPRARPCPAEGRFALGVTGSHFSSASALISSPVGYGAGPEGCLVTWLGTEGAARGLHLAVAEDLAEVVAGHGKGAALRVAEAGAADLGVGHTLGVAVLDLQREEEPA